MVDRVTDATPGILCLCQPFVVGFDALIDIRNHANQGFGNEPDDRYEIRSTQKLCYIQVASEVSRMNESAREIGI